MTELKNSYSNRAARLSVKAEQYLNDISGLNTHDAPRYPVYILQGKMLLGEIDVLQKSLSEEGKTANIQLYDTLTMYKEQLRGIVDALEFAVDTKTKISQQKIKTMLKMLKERFNEQRQP